MLEVVTERLQFTTHARARRVLPLVRPEAGSRGGVLFAQCLAPGDQGGDGRYALTRLTRGLAEQGYAVLRWDFAGDEPAQDFIRAAVLLEQREVGPLVLVGHGAAAEPLVAAATGVKRLQAVVLVNAPAGIDVGGLGRPLLVIQSLADEVTPPESGESLFAAAAQPKAFTPLLASDHVLSSPVAVEEALRAITAWLHQMRGSR